MCAKDKCSACAAPCNFRAICGMMTASIHEDAGRVERQRSAETTRGEGVGYCGGRGTNATKYDDYHVCFLLFKKFKHSRVNAVK